MFVADSLWLLLPALYLNGAAYAFRSGAQQAFLFDSLGDEPTGTRFTNLLGRLNAVAYVAIAATTAIGASLAERDYASAVRTGRRRGVGRRVPGRGSQGAAAARRRGRGAWVGRLPRHCASSAATGSSWP